MFKRVSSVIMAIAMMLTMLCTICVASADAPMTLGVTAKDGVNISRGDTVTLTFAVKDYVPANGIYVQGYYDSDVFTHDRTRARDFSGSLTNNAEYSAEMPYFASIVGAEDGEILDDDDNVLTNFELLRVTFKVNDDAPYGTSTMRFSYLKACHIVGTGGAWYTPGVEFSADEVVLNFTIACPHANKGTELTQPVAGTAEADAKHGYLCGDCGELVDAVACDFEDISEPETCDKNGVDGIKCKDCGYKIATTIDEIDGHDWQPDGLDAKENGKHVCANNAEETENCHFVSKGTTGGTCTEDLVETFECDVCGYTYTKTTVALGHVLKSNNDGTHSCENCDECDATCDYTKDVGSSGATCQVEGTVTKECECGDQKTITGAKKNHEWGEYTANGDGTHSATCTTCDPAVAVPAVNTVDCDYDYNDDMDCENDGTMTCGVCGDTVKDPAHPATDHAWSNWAHVDGTETHSRTCGNANCPVGTETKDCSGTAVPTGPSCDERGYTTTVCDDCGEEYVVIDETEAGDPLGHKFDWTHTVENEGTDDEIHYHASNGACLNGCGESVAKEECVFTVVDEPNCVDGGEAVCDICGYVLHLDPLGDGEHVNLVTVYKPTEEDEGGYFCDTCVDCGTEVLKFYETEAGAPFADLSVDSNVWFAAPANFCYTYGGLIIGEYGNFNGDGLVTRGQVVTVLGRLFVAQYGFILDDIDMYSAGDAWINGLTKAEFEEVLEFVAEVSDVTPVEMSDLNNQYYSRYARLMAALGVVRGRDDGTFDGDAKVNRAELATMLVRYIDMVGTERDFESPEATFSDLASCGWATEDVEAAGELGLFQGDEHGKFNPWATATRGQLATLMERLIRATEAYEIVDAE